QTLQTLIVEADEQIHARSIQDRRAQEYAIGAAAPRFCGAQCHDGLSSRWRYSSVSYSSEAASVTRGWQRVSTSQARPIEEVVLPRRDVVTCGQHSLKLRGWRLSIIPIGEHNLNG